MATRLPYTRSQAGVFHCAKCDHENTQPRNTRKTRKTRKHERHERGRSNAEDRKSAPRLCRTTDARHDRLLHRSAPGTRTGAAGKNLLTRSLCRARLCGHQVRAREAVLCLVPRATAVRAISGFRSWKPDCAGDQVDRSARACASRADPELHARGTPASRPADELQCRHSARWHEQKDSVIRCSFSCVSRIRAFVVSCLSWSLFVFTQRDL